ncbi:MAG TPA: prepilin-type N-terminal cleavage/methylation domain-containing protein [Verrucomicrobiae bacterium]|nr:prepilin-type N-terminal cleavage/methylation domain-containing protein [Verrucomicrobiae bacterium]
MSAAFAPERGGFSLLEIIIAIAVLSVAVVGLTEGISLALQSNKDSERESTAALYAAGVIETLRAEGDFEDGETEGDCGTNLALYRWKQSITSAGLDGLHQVTVTVENAKTGKSIYELQTLLFEAPYDTGSTNSARRAEPGARKRREP